jgi:hypothetical protein
MKQGKPIKLETKESNSEPSKLLLVSAYCIMYLKKYPMLTCENQYKAHFRPEVRTENTWGQL